MVAKKREVLATFTNVDFQRIRFWCLCSSVTIGYPRRLPDARPRELSFDKRVSRKVCGAYRQLWVLYSKDSEIPEPPEWQDWPIHHIDPFTNRIGATVIWDRQVEYLINVIIGRMTLLTDYEELARYDGLRHWYGKHALLLEWELDQMYRIQAFQQTERPTK